MQIPQALRSVPQWIAWKLVVDPEKGKAKKSPRHIETRKVIDPTDPANHSHFPERPGISSVLGIGFVLTEADPFVIFDLDTVTAEPRGALAGWASAFLARLPETYTEWSPSGKGVRLVFTLPKGARYSLPKKIYTKTYGEKVGNEHAPQVEFSYSGKFYTITGDAFEGRPAEPKEILPSLLRELAEEFSGEKLDGGEKRDTSLDLSEEEKKEIERMAKEDRLVWDSEDVRRMLEMIPVQDATDREPWLRVGMALRSWAGEDVEEGLRLFLLFSARAGKAYDPEGAEKTFRGLSPDGPVSIGTVVYKAKKAGWIPRNSLENLLPKNDVMLRDITDRMDIAVAAFHYDGKDYWSQEASGQWVPSNKEDTKEKLRVKFGIPSGRGKKCTFSADELAVVRIRDERRVDAVGPCVHQPEGVFDDRETGVRILNSSRIAPAPAADHCRGPSDFPFLHKTLETYYDDRQLPPGTPAHYQLHTMLAWLRYAYLGARDRRLEKGQVLIHAGPANSGKSLIASTVLGPALGGFVDASRYLTGETTFGASLFDMAVWLIDDPDPNNADARRKFSSRLKRIVANNVFSAEEKFRKAQSMKWNGRVVLLCNDDPESIRAMPNLDMANRDKTLLLRVAGGKVWPSWRELRETTARELPYFLRWLLDWTPPDYVIGTSRYHVKSWAHPHLLAAAESVGESAFTRELIVRFTEKVGSTKPSHRMNEFRGLHEVSGGFVWVGKASELESELARLDIGNPRDRSAILLGRALAAMVNREHPGVTSSTRGGTSIYRINIDKFNEKGDFL